MAKDRKAPTWSGIKKDANTAGDAAQVKAKAAGKTDRQAAKAADQAAFDALWKF